MSDILIVGSGFQSQQGIDIKKISEKMPVLAINLMIDVYPFAEYGILVDKKIPDWIKNYNGQKMIIPEQVKDLCKLKNFNIEYVFNPVQQIITKFNNERFLTYQNFTFVSAFSWAYCMGFKNIYTAGIELDYKNWDYLYGDKNENINADVLNLAIKKLLMYQSMLNSQERNIYTFWKYDTIGLKYIDYEKTFGGHST